MNLYDLIKFYGRKWRIIVALTVAGLLAGLVYNTFIQVPMYQGNSKLILVSSPTAATASNQTLINNYIDLIQSRRVLEPVVVKQNNVISYDRLVKAVSAVNQKDTAVIDVTVTTKSAKQSTDIANEITDSFKTAVNDLYQSSGVIVVDPAVEPTGTSNVNKPMQLGVAALIGLLIAIIIGFFMFDYQSSHPTTNKTKKTTQPSPISRIKKIMTPKAKPLAKKSASKKIVSKTTIAKVSPKKSTIAAKTANKKPIAKPEAKKKTPANNRKR